MIYREVADYFPGEEPRKEDTEMKKLMTLLSLALGVSLVVIGGTSFTQSTYAQNPPSEYQQMTTDSLHAYAPESN